MTSIESTSLVTKAKAQAHSTRIATVCMLLLVLAIGTILLARRRRATA